MGIRVVKLKDSFEGCWAISKTGLAPLLLTGFGTPTAKTKSKTAVPS